MVIAGVSPLSSARPAGRLFIVLLVLNVVFLALHILHQASFAVSLPSLFRCPFFSLSEELSGAAFFQYVLECWIVILLMAVARRSGDRLYFGWATLFLFFAIDDPVQIHERVGGWLALRFPDVALLNLRAEDTCEMVVLVLPGLLFLVLAARACRRPRAARHEHMMMVFFVAALVVFGIGLDLVHVGFREGSRLIYYGMGMLEDGGEMLMMSIICWYLFRLVGRSQDSRADDAAGDQSP